MNGTRKTLCELARYVGGRVVGDDQVEISKVASIEEAGPGEITFLASPRYRSHLSGCRASAIIVSAGVVTESQILPGKAFLETANPYLAFAKILQIFAPSTGYDGQIHAQSTIDPTASLADKVTVFPNVFISKDVKVGRGTVLYPGVYLGNGVEVGEDCVLYPQVTVREGCRLGNRVVLHAGVVVGSDGFGFAGQGKDRIKIPQIGIVQVEDDVEVGSNTTIDRATLGKTVIGRGTKIDNLVQIAHNVVIGENSVIAAQVGIAGSTRIGRDVTLAGQVGVVNHIQIGDGATIGPGSGIVRSVAPKAVLSGWIEAAPHREWRKVAMLLPRLPKLWSMVKALDKKVSQAVKGGGKESSSNARR